jgi:protein ImuB
MEVSESQRQNSSAATARFKRQKESAATKEGSVSASTAKSQQEKIYEKVLTLPLPMRDSKMLLKLLRLLLQSDPPNAPIQKVMLAAEPANPRATQGGLFLPSYPDPEKLELTVARLASLVGDSNIGSPELVDTHRPGAFRIRRFVPPDDTSEKTVHSDSENRRHAIGFRMFRPAPPARIELLNKRPARVFFLGMWGNVAAVSGPWRTSGDWWREDAWKQEDWDLEIIFEPSSNSVSRDQRQRKGQRRGVYCFFFDSIQRSWFVRGTYD